jgi:hypothetical protein
MRNVFGAAIVLAVVSASGAEKKFLVHSFTKQQLTDEFWAEGAHFGDFNKDGHNDIASGPYWYEGPDFTKRNEFYPAKESFKIKDKDGTEKTIRGFEGALSGKNAYSKNFLMFTGDYNKDGWIDIFVVGFPGDKSYWYENPKGKGGHWPEHTVIDVTDNESASVGDMGFGQPALYCSSKGHYGYAIPGKDPTQPWEFHKISPNNNYHKFTHGIGIGDVNGDKRIDLIEKDGWWEQPKSLAGDPEWTKHPFAFGKGGSQAYAYDFDNDGDNDVLTAIQAHEYGLAWFEQVKGEHAPITFKEHVFVNKEPSENKYGVHFSQPHAVELIDMDNDGVKDIVTGKRFWAHGPTGDPEPMAPAVLYWFKTVRAGKPGEVDFVPFQIDNDSGVGTQVVAGKVDKDQWPDVIVGNKKGTFFFKHTVKEVKKAEWEEAQPKPFGK